MDDRNLKALAIAFKGGDQGNILIWEFNTDDALSAPVVLVAESVVGG